jgi:hypothetical protein
VGEVDGAVAKEGVTAEQFVERHVEDREDRDAEKGLPVQGPDSGGPLCMPAQLLNAVRATTDYGRSSNKGLLSTKLVALLFPLAWHPLRLMRGRSLGGLVAHSSSGSGHSLEVIRHRREG